MGTKRTVAFDVATPGLDARGDAARVPIGMAEGGVGVLGGEEPELGGDHMLVNIGPQHPATHGVLRLVVELDGEVVVLDSLGRPSFQRLQQRVHLTRATDIQAATVALPATLFVFDILAAVGFDLRSLPLVERKKILQTVLPPVGSVRRLRPESGGHR